MNANLPQYSATIAQWLQHRLSEEQQQWLSARLDKHPQSNSDRELYITLGMIPRKLGKLDLQLSAEELTQAEQARAGWDPTTWSLETAARLLVLCKLAEQDADAFSDTFNELCRSADLTESITLYSGIALFPQSDILDFQIGQGLRSNIRAVFEAIAHRNPYPKDFFDQNRWNHMVLKALFVDSTLHPIQGLDARANAELARILCDYAHERWAAARPVTYELWRCVGPFAENDMLDDLQRAAQSTDHKEHCAAALALSQCSEPHAGVLLDQYADTKQLINEGTLTWNSLEA